MEPREPKGAIGPEIYAGQGVEVKGFVMRRQESEKTWKVYVAVFMAQLSSDMMLRCRYRASRQSGLLLLCCGFVANNDAGPTLIRSEHCRTMAEAIWLCVRPRRSEQSRSE